jgi:two-component system, LuxR family, sensor kinase FixL
MSLNWVLIVWSTAASASLTLAAIHFLVWFKSRTAWANLLFSLAATAVVVVACCELWMMRAETPAEIGAAVRWGQVAVWVVLLSLTGFVMLYLRAGRRWLAWTFCGLRTFSLALNFLVGQNLNYLEITGLRHIRFLGESVAVARGVANPLMLVGQLSLVLLMAFVADAALSVWRRGERRLALVTGGSIFLCILGAAVQGALVVWGTVQLPLTPSLFFVAIVVAMSYAMSLDLFRATQLALHLEKSEAALRQSEWRYNQAAEAANIGAWEWNIARDEIWATDRGRALIGFSPGQRIDFNSVFIAIHPEDRDAVRGSFMRSLETGRTYEWRYRVLLTGGGVRWIATRCRVEADVGGKPSVVRGISFDVTERVRAAEEIALKRSELAHVSRVSTLNELSSSIAHEINQPLQSILSNAQAALLLLAKENPNFVEVREILKDIVVDDKRASEVMRELRSLIKKGESRVEALDINEQVRSAVRLLNSELRVAGVTTTVTLAPDLPLIKGDRVQLQQVLLNLIINGCEAMATVSRENRELLLMTQMNDDKSVLVCVTDRGPGIPPQNLERVFDSFFTTKTNGLGLGLSVSRLIISTNGGRLWASANRIASGACFCFTVPAASSDSRDG